MSLLRGLAVLAALFACKASGPSPSRSSAASSDTDVAAARVRSGDTVAVSESAFSFDTTKGMDTHRFVINGVMLDETEAQVRSILGAPRSRSRKEYAEVIGDSVWHLDYGAVTVGFARGTVDEITCAGVSCSTADGVRIGDTWARVHEVYGSSLPNDAPQRATYWGRRCDCAMTFEFVSEKVASIRIWYDES